MKKIEEKLEQSTHSPLPKPEERDGELENVYLSSVKPTKDLQARISVRERMRATVRLLKNEKEEDEQSKIYVSQVSRK